MQTNSKLKLYKVARQAVNLLRNYDRKESLEAQIKHHDLASYLKEVTDQDLPFQSCQNIHKGVGVRNILWYGGLRMSLYYIPKGQVKQLHDYPNMELISYVFNGNLLGKFYTQLQGDVFKRQMSVLGPQSLISIQNNAKLPNRMQELSALQSSFMMDIAFPDYNQKKPVTFYVERRSLQDNLVDLKESNLRTLDLQQF